MVVRPPASQLERGTIERAVGSARPAVEPVDPASYARRAAREACTAVRAPATISRQASARAGLGLA
jgi:hypothetical protein